MTADGPRGNVAVVGTGAMGAGIAQVAATAGHHVYLQDAGADRAEAAAEGLGQRLAALAAKGRLDQRGGPRGGRPPARRRRPRRPPGVRARDRGRRRGPRGQAVRVRGAEPAPAAHHAAGDQRVEPRHRRHRRAGPRPGAGDRAALLQPRTGDAARRGRARHRERPDLRRLRRRPHGVLGQDPGALRVHAGVHASTASPAPSTGRGSGCSRRASPTPPRSTRACAPPASGWGRSS